jgi:hypothetical protein
MVDNDVFARFVECFLGSKKARHPVGVPRFFYFFEKLRIASLALFFFVVHVLAVVKGVV